MMKECREAAGLLASEGVDVELVDIVTLKPFNAGVVLESVRRAPDAASLFRKRR